MSAGDDVHVETAKVIESLQAQLQEMKKALLAAKTEAVLYRAQADEYRLLYEGIPLPYQSLNEAGYFMDVSPTWLEMTGYARDEVVGSYFGDFLTHEHRDLFAERFARFKEAGEVHDVQFDLVSKTGKIVPVSFEGRIGRRGDGSFRQTHCVMRDLSVQKRAEEALRTANRWLQNAATLAPLPMGMFTEDGDIIFLNRAWLELSGYSGASLQTVWDWRDRVYGDRSAEIGAEIDSIFSREGRVHQGERGIMTASGEKRVWDFSVSQLGTLVDGRRAAISMAMDVTERKVSEAKIAQLNRLYRFLSEVNQAIVRTHSEQELFEQVCRVAVEHGGFPLAWIGLVDERSGQVVPRATHGDGCRIVNALNVSSLNIQEGDGVIGRSIRSGSPAVSNDLLNDEHMSPWREANLALGLNSCAAFPIKLGDRVVGAMCVDSTQKGFFDGEEVRLLEELTGDIAFAMRTMTIERQREAAEAALRESEQRYRSLFENSSDAVLLTDPDGSTLAANAAATRMFGYSEDELCLLGRSAIVNDGDPRLAAALEERARTGKVAADLTFKRKDGSPVEVEITSTIFRDEKGRPRSSMIIRDVSERKRAEEVRSRLAAIVEFSEDAIIGKTLDGVVTSWNPAAQRLYGYTAEEMIGMPISMLIPEEIPDDLPFVLHRVREGNHVSRYETVRRRKDGERLDVSITVSPVKDFSGAITGAATIARNITERKRAEKALQERTELLQTILDNIPVMINFFDEQGHFAWGNRRWEKVLGWTAEEMADGDPMEKVYPDPSYRRSVLECIGKANGDWEDFKNRTRDGRTLDVTWANIRLSNGTNVGIGIDITERKRMEEQLLRAQRLETAGTVAGQVAHDFNNLLGPVMAYPDMIIPSLPEGSPAREYCEIIVEAAKHMAEINDDLLALSRRGRLETGPVDLNRLVLQAVEPLNNVSPGLALDLQMESELLPAEGSASQLLRVFQNLISNARDAMRDTGVLTLSTANVYVDAPAGAYNRVEQGEYVRVTVADTGCGIPEAIRGRIFDAFFSTKRGSRRGCGLGLAVVQSIIEDHRGFIDLESKEGAGTTFTVYLPISRSTLEQETLESRPAGHERILVVDDDPLQRRVLTEILRTRGYEVDAVASGEESLGHLRAKRPDLVLLDMMMPGGMDGAETYREILRVRPRQRAILISGFADTEQVQRALALGAGAFLHKPVTLQQLSTAVRQELDRK